MSAERFSLPTVPILNENFAPLSRLSGQVIILNNFGAYNQFNEIIVGATNVGTVLTFTKAIKNYLYIDITFQGDAAAVIVYGPGRVLQFAQGASGVPYGQYTRRIPYCGDIESLTFLQVDYVVKSIDVVSELQPYSVEETDLTQFTLGDISGWTYANGTYSISLASLAGKTVTFGGMLEDGYVGRMGINVVPSATPNTDPTDTLYSDGSVATSLPMLIPVTLWIPTAAGSIVFTNNLNAAVTLQLTPSVISFLPLASAFGATPV